MHEEIIEYNEHLNFLQLLIQSVNVLLHLIYTEAVSQIFTKLPGVLRKSVIDSFFMEKQKEAYKFIL
ncbi:MAG: hypothetical protein N2504_03860 [candidate division WOR-3 bacterium]|nr:hypothetical protein [candidate division WOR-3 bacterium]MCX7947704.1 hypothetical protein [candidate division WOR-3 bacterium]MDW8150581.1 hypothetical protein [candidate division WOR-3 bacterium]